MHFAIYKKRGCPYCTKAIVALKLHTNFKLYEYELDRDFDRHDFYEKFGPGATFPQVVLYKGGAEEYIGGAEETIKYLDDQRQIAAKTTVR